MGGGVRKWVEKKTAVGTEGKKRIEFGEEGGAGRGMTAVRRHPASRRMHGAASGSRCGPAERREAGVGPCRSGPKMCSCKDNGRAGADSQPSNDEARDPVEDWMHVTASAYKGRRRRRHPGALRDLAGGRWRRACRSRRPEPDEVRASKISLEPKPAVCVSRWTP